MKMKKLTIPLFMRNLERQDPDAIIQTLHRIHPDIVFFAMSTYRTDPTERRIYFDLARRMIKKFSDAGLTVGLWLRGSGVTEEEAPFTYVTGADGHTSADRPCLLDPNYLSFVEDYYTEVAKLGVKTIMFDDDFRYSHFGRLVAPCLCDRHMADICGRLGEQVSREFLAEQVIGGGPNRYRDAWMASMGASLEAYVTHVRAVIDRIDPTIRFGLCTAQATWDGEGTNAIRLVKILAGNTRPFLRFAGSSYWAPDKLGGNLLMDAVEVERMQASWCEGEDIELIIQADAFPRPRFTTTGTHLEMFQTALIADGRFETAHKYMMDYFSPPKCEPGYIQYHLENAALREQIGDLFDGKDEAGVCIFESMEKAQLSRLRTEDGRKIRWDSLFYPMASRLLWPFSIPTRFGQNSRFLVVFGENARHIAEPEAHDYLLDSCAAHALEECGIDVGIKAWETVEKLQSRPGSIPRTIGSAYDYPNMPKELYDPSQDLYCGIHTPMVVEQAELKDGCRVMLYYNYHRYHFLSEYKKPAAYLYENANGQKFFVWLFDSRLWDRKALRDYPVGHALIEGIRAIAPDALPVICEGNPDLYILTKRKGNKLAVGLFNSCIDRMLQRKITLCAPIKSIRFVGCNGSFDGNVVEIDRLGGMEMAAFEAELEC